MDVKELISLLENCPQDLPVKLIVGGCWSGWIHTVEIHNTGDSGYEIGGEIILTGEE